MCCNNQMIAKIKARLMRKSLDQSFCNIFIPQVYTRDFNFVKEKICL